MFRLRWGFLVTGITTGLVVLFSFLFTIPDGKLHIVFCDVGQGDASYVRFPDGRDMLVDGGPNDRVLGCLGRYMPFWDRKLDLVIMTHPQKDHMQGLLPVLDRFRVDYFVRSDIDNSTEGYQKLQALVKEKSVSVKYLVAGDLISIGKARMNVLWPSHDTIGASGVSDLNDFSLVFHLRYGSFDAIFTGDADSRVEPAYTGIPLTKDDVELLKVPHHGSRTGMTQDFIQWLRPKLAVISVGKNSYGHPTKEALSLLAHIGARVLRTDTEGDIEVISDGSGWVVQDR